MFLLIYNGYKNKANIKLETFDKIVHKKNDWIE